MLAKNIIDEIIQPLKPADNCLQVLSWMEEYKVMHLPVVENGMYKGLLAEADIYALPEPDISVSGISETLTRDAVKAEDHFFNVLPHFSEHQHSVVPVVAKNDEYVG
ncbi:MAG TPA: CBS domain-containing protein, partial [Bacteroidales bacterium]|nr:CBS domain-containing protein [Bacteroidales bacterium]